MSEAREQILAGVRRALATADTAPVTVPRSYRDTGAPDRAAMLDLFVERVADYRATVVRCEPGEVEDRIADALADGARVVVPDGFPGPFRAPSGTPGARRPTSTGSTRSPPRRRSGSRRRAPSCSRTVRARVVGRSAWSPISTCA